MNVDQTKTSTIQPRLSAVDEVCAAVDRVVEDVSIGGNIRASIADGVEAIGVILNERSEFIDELLADPSATLERIGAVVGRSIGRIVAHSRAAVKP